MILPAIALTIIEIPRLFRHLHTRSLHAMESLRWRRFLLPLLPVALVLLGGVTTEVTGFGYLESLTPSLPSVTAKESAILSTKTTTKTTGDYLDSLRHNPEGVAAATTKSTTTDAIASTDWAETIAETPDDHYSKVHPGAGWAGYKHPMYGGYLDNLASSSSTENNSSSSSSNNNDGTAAAATQGAPSTTSACVLEAGKKADYGDDIRWGAQVYLDNLK